MEITSFWKQIRLYSTRSMEKDLEDYQLYLAHCGLSNYLYKLANRYNIHVPKKEVWNNDTLLRLSVKVVKRNYLADKRSYGRIESILRKYHQATIREAYWIVSSSLMKD